VWFEPFKDYLNSNPRNLCLFTVGINTGYRANEFLRLKVGDVQHLKTDDQLELRETKTGKARRVSLNQITIRSIQQWISCHPDTDARSPLFVSRKFSSALSVSTVCNLVKGWCREADLIGNFGSHTLRKTWGYHQLRNNPSTSPHMVLPLLMEAYGHATQRQTLEYLCIEPDEIRELYRLEL